MNLLHRFAKLARKPQASQAMDQIHSSEDVCFAEGTSNLDLNSFTVEDARSYSVEDYPYFAKLVSGLSSKDTSATTSMVNRCHQSLENVISATQEQPSSSAVLNATKRIRPKSGNSLPQEFINRTSVAASHGSEFEDREQPLSSSPHFLNEPFIQEKQVAGEPPGLRCKYPNINDCLDTDLSDEYLPQSSSVMAVSSLDEPDTYLTELCNATGHQKVAPVLAHPIPLPPEQYHNLLKEAYTSTLPLLGAVATQVQLQNSGDHQHVDDLRTSSALNDTHHEDEEVEDLSPLEYARINGLSRDKFQEPSPYLDSNLDIFGATKHWLTHDSHLPQFELIATVNTEERLTMSKDAAVLLGSVSPEESYEWVDETLLQMIDVRQCRNLKLELPLLRSDHETDCKQFAQRAGFEIKLQKVKLPLEAVDGINTGAAGVSPNVWNKGVEFLDELKKEKLEVTRDTLIYLQSVLKIDWTEEDEKVVWESVRNYKKSSATEPVTPPLSPVTTAARPYEPSVSDPVFDIPLLSDPASLTGQDLNAIEHQLFENDVPTPIKNERNKLAESFDTVKLADNYSPAASVDRPAACPRIETVRVKWGDFKVEEPLTPPKPTEVPKNAQFEDMAMKPPVVDYPTDPLNLSFLEEAFGEAHAAAIKMSEQERLIAADTTARVDVPFMDFAPPIPPWHLHTSQLTEDLKVVMKALTNKHGLSKWSSTGNVKMLWNPFPRNLARLALEEPHEQSDGIWQAFIKSSSEDDIINTSTLTWKPPGLRILKEDDDEDDDEVEPAKFDKGIPQDFSWLVRKRKMEIEERDDPHSVLDSNVVKSTIQQPPRKKAPRLRVLKSTEVMPQNYAEGGAGLLMGGNFAVGSLVDDFFEMRGTKKPKLGASSHFPKTTEQTPIVPMEAVHQPEPLFELSTRQSPVPPVNLPLPAPPSNLAEIPANVIVASTLLKHRALIKHVESLAPQTILVERDFSAHDTTIWLPGSVARSPIMSPLASEADIIISPFIGIIITTLQKIKQKPLPGQKTKVAIRDRVEKVSARYEKVIIHVTEGRQDETTRDIDDGDCSAFSEFIAFTLTLPTSISVQFVGGGEETLAKWIVNSISAHKVNVELLPEETHWELFLRRSGMNAFAAQAVIAEVKAPDDVNVSSSSKAAHFGLTAFVEMGREQRLARFGPICGEMLMERVSAKIDARWS